MPACSSHTSVEMPRLARLLGRVQTGWSAADDEDVDVQRRHYKGCFTIRTFKLRPWRPCASQLPAPVIQNDSTISFRSRQRPARFRYSRSSRNLLVRGMSRGA